MLKKTLKICAVTHHYRPVNVTGSAQMSRLMSSVVRNRCEWTRDELKHTLSSLDQFKVLFPPSWSFSHSSLCSHRRRHVPKSAQSDQTQLQVSTHILQKHGVILIFQSSTGHHEQSQKDMYVIEKTLNAPRLAPFLNAADKAPVRPWDVMKAKPMAQHALFKFNCQGMKTQIFADISKQLITHRETQPVNISTYLKRRLSEAAGSHFETVSNENFHF